MTRNHEELKSRFIATLAETKRTGIESVLEKLEAVGFYSAPASSRFHCAYEGGLLEHSMCVYDQAVAIRWHMGAWDLSEYGDARGSFNASCDKAPLLPLLMAADGLASRISERRDEA